MREYFGENLYREMAMDEALPAPESERKDDKADEDGPSITALGGCVDEAAEALDGIRAHLKRGAAGDGSFSFAAVKRRIADARDCMDRIEEQLGSGAEGKDEEPPASERDAAFRRARDGETDHRRDFDPRGTSADSRRGLAHDRRRAEAYIDIDEIFPETRPQGDGADVRGHDSSFDGLDGIFAPAGR
jgi:hypothetical protein